MDHDYRSFYPAPLRWLSALIDFCLVLGGALIIFLTFGNAALRGVGINLAWSLEITSFLMLWLTFLGCAAASARGTHMRVVEVAAALVPGSKQRVLALIIHAAVALLMCALIYYGLTTAIHMWPEETTVLYWPVGLSYASMPVGIGLSLLFHLNNAALDLTGKGPAETGQLSAAEEENREGLA